MATAPRQDLEGTLLVIRHGIAEDRRPGQRDAERALTGEGWQKTRAAMRGLAKLGPAPQAAFASPYRRAQETLDCLREALREAGLAEPDSGTWEGLTPEADPGAAEAWIRQRFQERPGTVVAIVSHQPFLGGLVHFLTGQAIDLRKASCTVVERRAGGWRLVRHYPPSELRDKG